MKKTAFVCFFVLSIMLFSCSSDTADSNTDAAVQPMKFGKTMTKEQQQMNTDSLSTVLDKTAQSIDNSIQSLNKAEADLDKAFDF